MGARGEVIRVVLHEENPAFRERLRTHLSLHGDIEVAGEAVGHDDLADLLRNSPCDVLLVGGGGRSDGWMSLLSGLPGSPPAIVLSEATSPQYAERAFNAGAAGYLPKMGAGDRLAEAVRQVAAGGRFVYQGREASSV